jgi:hypothetical protein
MHLNILLLSAEGLLQLLKRFEGLAQLPLDYFKVDLFFLNEFLSFLKLLVGFICLVGLVVLLK